MSTTPPGWYDDGHGALRWWDGAHWTEHVAEPDPEPAVGVAPETGIAPAPTPEGMDATPGGPQAPAVPAEPTAAESVLPPELAAEFDAAAAASAGMPSPAGSPDYTAYTGTAPTVPGNPAYPGGYPADYAGQGAFVSATEPTKSKLWIVWVVLGVVLLGIVIGAAVLIPLLFLSLTSSSSVSPEGEAQTAAVAAVELYDEAWQEVDCDKLVSSTTDDFRSTQRLDDCEVFEAQAAPFAASVENYEVSIDTIAAADDEIVIETTETYDALFDQEGNPTDQTSPFEVHYRYTIVPEDGGWLIDDLANAE
ncbi:DUF2510 domain-containing protein [Microbacterium hominis]|uniref:DUF2510 domain-containing protein n=1 Tax=Microbacterium hominis TaxID=162426 RepID=A0A7D4PL16_9MICO|nr:DUF2510 domain-containing protein [Microbacterium hominis]QKJ18610.1 DUF2510 domain-containing protein [Microbacterium hominis]